MKTCFPALLLLALAACRAQPAATPGAPSAADDSTPAVLDFSAWEGRSLTLEEFVHACQQASGFNMTYTQATKDALGASTVRPFGSTRIPAEEFESFFAAQLDTAGFEFRHVGPPHLRVLAIGRRAS